MLDLVKKISGKIGFDETIAFTVISRIVQGGGGIITLVFIAKYLTNIEQGYYYTFGSILAIQVFFELGLSGVITQFVAHENANLNWHDKISFNGSEEAMSRLSSLLHFTLKWFGVISIFLLIGLLTAGFIFFNKFDKNNEYIEWQIPWVILSFNTSLSLMMSPILAFFEGLGRIREVAKIRMIQQIVQILLLFILFSLGFKLFSTPVAAIIAFAIIPLWIIFSSKIKLLKFIWNKSGSYKVNYRLEIFPFQWKIAISWISGYFIFQLFNPVLFATEGAVVAGQMGMTLTMLNAIFTLTFSWMTTKIPVYSNFIAKNQHNKLDYLFNKTLLQSSFLIIIMQSLIFCLILLLRYLEIKIDNKIIADRFLSNSPLFFMTVSIVLNHFVSSWALYMRCHKKEPMLIQSIAMAILCTFSTVFLGETFGVFGMTLGYMLLSILGFLWTYLIFINEKKLKYDQIDFS